MAEKKQCPRCGREIAVLKDGTHRKHKHESSELWCVPGDTPVQVRGEQLPVSDPAPTVEAMDDTQDLRDPVSPNQAESDRDNYVVTKGPWFGAMYEGACDGCFDRIEEGDRIRADGQGGYECTPCGDNGEDAIVVVPIVEIRLPAAPGPMPTPDEFMDPAKPEEKLNVSGQPPARRDHLKRYIVVDPDLGDFRRTKKERKPVGITRATTFNKHAQNTIALNGWSKRNVVMGASLRPDILRRAHGLHHDKSRDEREALDRVVDELEKAAGAKVAADEGSFLHETCDQVDAGLRTWQDAPQAYQQDIRRYTEALAAEGLEPVPGLIERTTFIREFGGVCGTFDRIFYHRPSGQYIVGDLKTGKTMKYAMDETECQIWTYAHGVNQTGIYDWNTDTWGPVGDPMTKGPHPDGTPITVSETVGVIVHMPVQGPEAGEVYLRFANLERGHAYAELNNAVKSYEKSKVAPFEMPELSWEQRFAAVTSGGHANQLWREAKAAGITGVRLVELVAIARTALAGKG